MITENIETFNGCSKKNEKPKKNKHKRKDENSNRADDIISNPAINILRKSNNHFHTQDCKNLIESKNINIKDESLALKKKKKKKSSKLYTIEKSASNKKRIDKVAMQVPELNSSKSDENIADRIEEKTSSKKKVKKNFEPISSINKDSKDAGNPNDLNKTKLESQAMALLLHNEIQQRYNASEGKEFLGDSRHFLDHIDRYHKKGAYTNEEKEILKKAIDDYFLTNGWEFQEGWKRINVTGSGKGFLSKVGPQKNHHWSIIGLALPQRPLHSIVKFACRRLYPWKSGPWSAEEEKELVTLVQRYGPRWTQFALEYFNRMPNYISMKWKELMPHLKSWEKHKFKPRTHWSREDDAKLLSYIKLVTGVPLPYKSIPWSEVQNYIPEYSITQMARRYKQTLFPSILGGQYKGARISVIFRQFVRYAYYGLKQNIFKDLTEIDTSRVVPFWVTASYKKWLTKYVKLYCPEFKDAPFSELIEYLYKKLGCEEKEISDLRRLTHSFKTLQRINGVQMIPFEKSTGANEPPQSSHESNKPTLFVKTPLLEKVPKSVCIPLTVSLEKIKEVVPENQQSNPAAFPIYLNLQRKREQSAKDNQEDNELDNGELYSALGLTEKNKKLLEEFEADLNDEVMSSDSEIAILELKPKDNRARLKRPWMNDS